MNYTIPLTLLATTFAISVYIQNCTKIWAWDDPFLSLYQTLESMAMELLWLLQGVKTIHETETHWNNIFQGAKTIQDNEI